ncbi:MAG: hypothetical protein ACI9BO_002728, partial [Zhongshania sp.]
AILSNSKQFTVLRRIHFRYMSYLNIYNVPKGDINPTS